MRLGAGSVLDPIAMAMPAVARPRQHQIGCAAASRRDLELPQSRWEQLVFDSAGILWLGELLAAAVLQKRR